MEALPSCFLCGIFFEYSKVPTYSTYLPFSTLNELIAKQEIIIRNGDFLNSDAIRSSFIGEHITYAVEDCQQVIS